MVTKISDENFSGPSEINLHPCLSSSRFLNAVDETVIITQVCQDSYNTSLVVFNISLVGAFLFTPTLKIIAVDEDTSYETNNVTCPIAVGHYQNPIIPINTNCVTWHGTLVFDVGSKIPNYTTASNIIFRLDMDGAVPQAYGVSFPNQSFSTTYSWQKGVLPVPISLTYNGNVLGIVFQYEGNRDCSCNILLSRRNANYSSSPRS
jgi:hypothetical protein